MAVNGPLMPLFDIGGERPHMKMASMASTKSSSTTTPAAAAAGTTTTTNPEPGSVKLPALADPHSAALWATTSRVLSCLVTESLLVALYVKAPIEFTLSQDQKESKFCSPSLSGRCSGVAIVLTYARSQSWTQGNNRDALVKEDVYLVLPLVDPPVLIEEAPTAVVNGPSSVIGLIDPMDMLPIAFTIEDIGQTVKPDKLSSHISTLLKAILHIEAASLALAIDYLPLWDTLAKDMQTPEDLKGEIAAEFRSSIKMQEWNYVHPPALPNLDSLPIEWEQSIVTGHPTHPMHRTRLAFPPVQPLEPTVEAEKLLKQPRIRIVSMPLDSIECSNVERWNAHFSNVVKAAFSSSSEAEEDITRTDRIFMPVHEVQIPSIAEKFPVATIYPPSVSLPALAQQSTRTILLKDGSIIPSLSLKLAIGVKLTSAMRTISPNSAFLGPRLCDHVLPKLTYDSSKVAVLRELASVVAKHDDPEIAKHCAAIIREAPDAMPVVSSPSPSGSGSASAEGRNEIIIVSTSLMDWGHANGQPGVPAVIQAFGLDSEEKRVDFLDRYIRVLLEAFLPSMIHNGFAFEAHPQNTLARFSATYPHELVGFYIRDFGGLKVHLPTLEESTKTNFEGTNEWVKDGHSVLAHDLEGVYARMYHTIVHNHLQQLARVLGLHHNGVAYALLRHHLDAQIPAEHSLRTSWLSPDSKTVPGKCFVRMRIQGMFRFHLHGPFPNLIHYPGSEN